MIRNFVNGPCVYLSTEAHQSNCCSIWHLPCWLHRLDFHLSWDSDVYVWWYRIGHWKICKTMQEHIWTNRSNWLGRILVHEMENLYASIPISFMRRTSSCSFFVQPPLGEWCNKIFYKVLTENSQTIDRLQKTGHLLSFSENIKLNLYLVEMVGVHSHIPIASVSDSICHTRNLLKFQRSII
jgi:hypothetical protein